MTAMAQAVPPSFAMGLEAKNWLATKERKAIDDLLAHRGTDADAGEVMGMLEVAIRAIRIAKKHPACKLLDRDALELAERSMHRAGHAIHHAKARQSATGCMGFDAADRNAIKDADEWVGVLRQRGMILRLVWGMANKEACRSRAGIQLMPLEQCRGDWE